MGGAETRIAAAWFILIALSGCSSIPDSIKGPFARHGSTVSDAGTQPPEVSPFPRVTDQGKF